MFLIFLSIYSVSYSFLSFYRVPYSVVSFFSVPYSVLSFYSVPYSVLSFFSVPYSVLSFYSVPNFVFLSLVFAFLFCPWDIKIVNSKNVEYLVGSWQMTVQVSLWQMTVQVSLWLVECWLHTFSTQTIYYLQTGLRGIRLSYFNTLAKLEEGQLEKSVKTGNVRPMYAVCPLSKQIRRCLGENW